MRINENLTIRSSGCLLVPYRREHVPQYHEWMKDPYLQQTTESEPLTMEQEYEMQASWRNDEDKCTFILLDTSPDLVEASKADPEGTLPLQQRTSLMAGDVNLYWNDPEDRSTVEIEVMVAEQRSRRKGIAKQALQCMMAFAVQRLGVQRFRAKILDDNHPSLALFTQLGYIEVKRVAVFHEVHMELDVSPGTDTRTRLEQTELVCGTYE